MSFLCFLADLHVRPSVRSERAAVYFVSLWRQLIDFLSFIFAISGLQLTDKLFGNYNPVTKFYYCNIDDFNTPTGICTDSF